MVRLTRIYTKTGDAGETHLGDMSRVSKADPRVVAFADVDEANSVIGVALALAPPEPAVVDLLFILARTANPGGDVLWEPGAHSGAHAQRGG
jgi:cob(I)alamin adenosyltransferase